MPSIKDLKKRIGTVKNTQQTTRAMKMVSAAKLRRAQEAIQSQRPYAKKISELIQELSSVTPLSVTHPLMRGVEGIQSLDHGKKILLVLVTSDRGLCGGFNGNVVKACQKWINQYSESSGSVELACVGRKGHDFFKNRKVKILAYFQELSGKVTFGKAKKLADSLVALYIRGEVDEIKFIYNEFKNATTQTVVVEDFLPLSAGASRLDSMTRSSVLNDCIVKPSSQEVLQELFTKNFIIQAFRILLESQAGEHGARMSSMENATKNAGEMIRKLTLQFNKQRQAGITKELLEIISGSESQKG